MRTLLLAVLVFAAACADEPPIVEPAPDTGVPDAGSTESPDSGVVIEAPRDVAPAADPVLTPCPEHWSEVQVVRHDGTNLTACEPFPAGTMPCPIDQAMFPGDTACTQIGTPCPSGDWADTIPGSNVLYVKADATGAEMGTREAPYHTIAAAIANRGIGGAVVALAKGTYEESVDLERNVALVGACVNETVLTLADTGLDYGVVNSTAQFTSLSNVRIRSRRPGVWAALGGEIEVRDVVVESARGMGLLVTEGGVLSGGNIAIMDVTPSTNPPLGAGILGLSGSIELDRINISGVRGMAVFAQLDDTTVHLTSAYLHDLAGRLNSFELGRAGHVVSGAKLTIERSVAEHTKESAFNVSEAGAVLTLNDVVIRDVDGLGTNTGSAIQVAFDGMARGARLWIQRARHSSLHLQDQGRMSIDHLIAEDVSGDPLNRTYGRHVNMLSGGHAVLKHAHFARAREAGIVAIGAETTISLEDVRIEDNLGRDSDQTMGNGIMIQDGATSSIARAQLEGARFAGVTAITARIDAEDLVVRDMGSEVSDGTFGVGLLSQDGATVNVNRAVIERARYYAVYASAGRMSLSDIVVRETLPQEAQIEPAFSMGLVATSTGGVLEVVRARVEASGLGAIAASGPAVAMLADVVVAGTTGDPNTGRFGEGVYAEQGATITLERAAIEGAREFGAYANLGAHLVLKKIAVRGTAGNSEGIGGYGIFARAGSTVDVELATIEDNRVFGVAAEGEGTRVTLHDVEVMRTIRSSEGGDLPIEGTGFGAVDGGYLSAAGFFVAESTLCGIQVVRATMDLSDGVVTRNPIGANIDAQGFDLTRLQNGVRYEENGANYDSQTLPVPMLDPPAQLFTDDG